MSEDVRLDECPPGLFWFEYGGKRSLGFRSEYSSESKNAADIPFQPDAYVLESGEYFWGMAKTVKDRCALMVEPIDSDEIYASLGAGDATKNP